QDNFGSRLSTITEEPSDITEEALFRHGEPNWERHDNLASFACLRCANDGQEQAIPPVEDACESVWLHLQDLSHHNPEALDALSVPHITDCNTQEENFLELYYTSDM
ncbi:MAG: hypothetical protein ACKPKO_20310, partial [Candidatus Fonsibacter sp.]